MNKIKIIFHGIVTVALATVLVFSAWWLWKDHVAERTAMGDFQDLAQQRDITEEIEPEDNRYNPLYAQNPDMVGWLSIEGTTVDYPVMQTPDRPDFYLNHNFDQEYSTYGVPYVAENCTITPQSDNITIYGHHIRGGRMFAALDGYKSYDFFLEHPSIRFDTLTGDGIYQVFAAFRVNPDRFPYQDFVNATDEGEFDAFIRQIELQALYETRVPVSNGDKLLTLSTCEYSQKNNRLVIIAKKIEGDSN